MSVSELEKELAKEAVAPDGKVTLSNGKEVQIIDGQEATNRFLTHMEKLHSDQQMGFTTGFPIIDEATGGLLPAEYWIISALTSMGKTALALNICLNAMKEGAHCIFFSLEMNVESLMARAVASQGEINLSQLTKHKRFINPSLAYGKRTLYKDGNGEENGLTIMKQISVTLEKIRSYNPVFIDDPYMNIEEMKEFLVTYNRDVRNIDLVIPDYLQLIKGDESLTRERQVAHISNELKRLTKAIDATVIAPVQLSDEQKVRESRVIEQDANIHIMISADNAELKKGNKIPEGIKILKNRNGEKKEEAIPIMLRGRYQQFTHNE